MPTRTLNVTFLPCAVIIYRPWSSQTRGTGCRSRQSARSRLCQPLRSSFPGAETESVLACHMENSTVVSGFLHVNLTTSKEKPQNFRLSFEHHRHKQREEREQRRRSLRRLLGCVPVVKCMKLVWGISFQVVEFGERRLLV